MAVGKHRCTGCKKYFPAETMIKVTAGKFHDHSCLVDYGMKNTCKLINVGKKAKKQRNAQEKKDYYANDLPKQKKLTQDVFNKLRKLQEYKWFADRNQAPTCISCGKENMDWACGHFKTVASQGNLRYDPLNTYLQCNRACNSSLAGNIEGNKNSRGFKNGLIERFGNAEGQKIIDYCTNNTQVRKWTCDELIVMRSVMNKEIRLLESANSLI